MLDVLAEAGYVGERLNEWLIDFNQANKDTIGKLELDAEGRLLVSTYAEQSGFVSRKGNCSFGELLRLDP